jgi:hypothetical protein
MPYAAVLLPANILILLFGIQVLADGKALPEWFLKIPFGD